MMAIIQCSISEHRHQPLAEIAEVGLDYLRRADPIMMQMIDDIGIGNIDLRRRLEVEPSDHFGALFACFVGQRQSETDTIRQFAAFRQLFGHAFPTPAEIMSLAESKLANMLNSYRKAGFIHQLARSLVEGRLQLDDLGFLTDDEVSERLRGIHGVGAWSVEQILF